MLAGPCRTPNQSPQELSLDVKLRIQNQWCTSGFDKVFAAGSHLSTKQMAERNQANLHTHRYCRKQLPVLTHWGKHYIIEKKGLGGKKIAIQTISKAEMTDV